MKNLLLIGVFALISTVSVAQQKKIPLPSDQQPKVTTTIRQQIYTAGDTAKIANTQDIPWLIVNPAATKSTLKVKLPTRPYDNQAVYISFGGTITSGAVVTSLSIIKTGTQVILQTAAPTTANAGAQFGYRYRAASGRWYRIQ